MPSSMQPLWDHPTMAEKFDSLTAQDQAIRKKLKSAIDVINDVVNSQSQLSEDCASTVRYAMMRRDNVEQELAVLEAKVERATKYVPVYWAFRSKGKE